MSGTVIAVAVPPPGAVAFAVELADGTIGALGWMAMDQFDRWQRSHSLREGCRYVFAFPGPHWRPIAEAPEVAGDFFFCRVAWGPPGDMSTADAMRWQGRWFAASVFHAPGAARRFCFLEHEVFPTHYMRHAPPPGHDAEEDQS
jgi:hypothetical protein